MTTQAMLEKVLKVKAIKTQKAEMHLRQTRLDAAKRQELVKSLQERQQIKSEKLSEYAPRKFMELGQRDRGTFFTAIVVGLYRRRRELASLRLRERKSTNDYKVAREIQSAAAAELRVCLISEQRTSIANALKNQAEVERTEISSEDALTELVTKVSGHE